MSLPLILHAAAATHAGSVRPINQDQSEIFAWRNGSEPLVTLLVVADGMGGHRAGEVASRLAVDTLETTLNWGQLGAQALALRSQPASEHAVIIDRFQTELRYAVQAANLSILGYAIANPQAAGDLGTTLTAALIYGAYATIANVGDSRTYHWHAGELVLVTEDHSYVGRLVRLGQLAPEAIYDHPRRHLITRSLGQLPHVDVDVWTRPLAAGDRLLLCSDGLWEMVRDSAELCARLTSGSAEQAAVNLINAANAYGGLDNISVIVAEMRTA